MNALTMNLTLGDRITLIRKKKKITQAFLAKALGVAVDTLNAYEQDEVKPTYDHLLDIANALNVSLDLLTGRTDVELDFKNIQRIIDIQNMGPRHQDTMYYNIDAFIRDDKYCKIQGLTELQ